MNIVDPLKDERVVINVLVLPGSDDRDERVVNVMVGVADNPPMVRQGKLGDLLDLIHSAWVAHGIIKSTRLESSGEGEGAVLAEESLDGVLLDDDFNDFL